MRDTKKIRWWHKTTAIEWGLIAALIVVATISAMQGLGSPLGTTFKIPATTTLALPRECTAYADELSSADSLTGNRAIKQIAIICGTGSTMEIEDGGLTIRLTPPVSSK